MAGWIERRFLLAIPTLLAVSLFSFLLIHASGENFFDPYKTDRNWDPAVIRQMEREAHLDQPVLIQYLHWLRGVFFDVRIGRREHPVFDGESPEGIATTGDARVESEDVEVWSGRRAVRIVFSGPGEARIPIRADPPIDRERYGWLRVRIRATPGSGAWEVTDRPVESLSGAAPLEIPIASDGPRTVVVDAFALVERKIRFSAGAPSFGVSFQYNQPVFSVLVPTMGNTLFLSIGALLVTWLVAIPLGITCAVRQHRFTDRLLSTITFVGMSVPHFFVALLVLYGAVELNAALGASIFPVSGATSADHGRLAFAARILDRIHHVALPVVVLSLGAMAGLQRIMRGSLLEVLRKQYITTARAKGLREDRVIWRHAVRNAINPLITIFGYQLSALLGGSALIEILFGYPGMGRLLYEATVAKDVNVVLASVVVGGTLLVAGNLLADILLRVADPRIEVEAAR
ncbi:MAG: ABC transporter permease [Planctomycetes bacterium]|nr:ABC transporter permease [Planctomycetota bacterium]